MEKFQGNSTCAEYNCSICSKLDSDVSKELSRIARTRRYRPSETIVAEGEEIDFVGHVVEGVLRLQKTLHDGRQQIVGFLLPPDMFGRVFVKRSSVAIEASVDTTVCCFNRTAYEQLINRFPILEHRVLLSMTKELDAAQHWMLLLATQLVSERIATFLLILAKRAEWGASPSYSEIAVPVGRRDMAAYLGTTVESISRKIQEMARAKIISVIDAHHFKIINQRALVALSHHDLDEFDHLAGGNSDTNVFIDAAQ